MRSRITAFETPPNRFEVAVQNATARMRFSCHTNRRPSRMSATSDCFVPSADGSGSSAGVRMKSRQTHDTA